jgi:steroid delta-isomerase-like uncharacterized protein
MMNEQNKTIYRRFIDEVFNHGRVEKLGEFLAPDYVFRDAPPGAPTGPEGVAGVVKMFRAAFPDLSVTIEDQIAEGDQVCSRATTRGTHEGEFFGIAPTHRRVAMTGVTWVRIVDGRLVESWVKNDVMGLLKQLGATALPE